MPGSAPIVAALRRHPELDPRAVLAVAAQEGLGGGIGDNGSSFGPFQLHVGGAFPSSVGGDRQTWAWSPEGIDYALSRISGVAGGKRGGAAVNAIVRGFERPADPNGEVSRALAAYGGSGAGGAAAAMPTSSSLAAAAAPDGRRAFAQKLLAAISPTGQLNDTGLVGALQARQTAMPAPGGMTDATAPAPADSGTGGIAELLKEGLGGPTHSTGRHVHAAFTDPRLELAAIGYARQLGLHVGENPYVGDVVDPVHAEHSYHYRTFPGMFNGRKLGEAFDASGNPAAEDTLFGWLAKRRGR